MHRLNYLIVIILQLFLIKTVIAQNTSAGMKATQLEKFGLAKQISGLNGYDIRARKIVVPAGVSIAEHSHTTRPGIVYVESGEIIEYRGKESRLLKAGDSLVEDFTTVHSYKNINSIDCVLIAFDIPKKNK